MGKNEKFKSKFAEALDPRFLGIFQSPDVNGTSNSTANSNITSSSAKKESTGGLQTVVSRAMTEYFESNIKYVDKEINEKELFQFKADNEDVAFFSDDSLNKELEKPSQADVHKKKKRKKEKINEDELLKQVAVTPDWIYKQAGLLNS